MKKIKTNKLALSSETLVPLTGGTLDLVNGGNAAVTRTMAPGCSAHVGCNTQNGASQLLGCFGR
jgi:hypothetical protein